MIGAAIRVHLVAQPRRAVTHAPYQRSRVSQLERSDDVMRIIGC
jgi:hypothetical protein